MVGGFLPKSSYADLVIPALVTLPKLYSLHLLCTAVCAIINLNKNHKHSSFLSSSASCKLSRGRSVTNEIPRRRHSQLFISGISRIRAYFIASRPFVVRSSCAPRLGVDGFQGPGSHTRSCGPRRAAILLLLSTLRTTKLAAILAAGKATAWPQLSRRRGKGWGSCPGGRGGGGALPVLPLPSSDS
jgi:hypothetical protein